MMRFILGIIIIFFCFTNCKRANNIEASHQRKQIDSLMEAIDKRIHDNFDYNQFDKTMAVLDSLRQIVEIKNDDYFTYKFLCLYGKSEMHSNNTDSAKYYYYKALELAFKIDTSLVQVNYVKLMLGREFINEKKYDSALAYLKPAYQFFKNKGQEFALSCLCLAQIYFDSGDMEMFRRYNFEGYNKTNDEQTKTSIATNILLYYYKSNKLDSAISFFNTNLLPDTLKNNRPKNYFALKNNQATLLMDKGEVLEAQRIYFKLLEKYRKLDHINEINEKVYFNIGISFQKLKNPIKAYTYFDSAMYLAITNKDIQLESDVLHSKAQTNFDEKKFKLSFILLDSSFTLYQNYVDTSYAKQAQELDKKYSIKAKDDEIEKLAITNKATAAQAKQRLVLLISFVIGSALLLILMLVLLRQRKLQNANEKLVAETKKTDLEQRLLRTQMEPHFIFNSLTILQAQIHNGENKKAGKYLSQFARLLRTSLENSRESFVPLAEEIEALQDYCSLQAMRFENLFEYTICAYDGYEDESVFIPPMLLQPFVENAIIHGMRNITHKGKVSLSIQKENGLLCCIIEDNGVGQIMHSHEKQKSLSTTITHERLSMLSTTMGKPTSLNISNKTVPDTGTIVEIIFPYKTN